MKGLIVNGPNLNLLGKREKSHYGSLTLNEINNLIIKEFKNVKFDFFQSNYEGALIDQLQDLKNYDFVVINPGALAHYSIALRDAFELVTITKGVCHLSEIEDREDFRKLDLLKGLADVYVSGLKEQSYIKTIKRILKIKQGE